VRAKVEIKARALNILAQVPGRIGFCQRLIDDVKQIAILAANVNESLM
jgi:hypothetical protein